VITAGGAEGSAPARAALAGNPSDGYGGAVVAVTLPKWQARAQVTPGSSVEIEPPNALVHATLDRFARDLEPQAGDSHVRWTTSIPQRVGLGSSSALIIAVTRALARLYGTRLSPDHLAEFALAVETEELGIVAGLQDRLTQAYGGLLFMDFTDPPVYEPLDDGLLPPLVIAWRETAAAHSGEVHSELRRRHHERDPDVLAAMNGLATAAREARAALLERDAVRFGRCMDATFELRQRLMPLDPRSVEMIDAARAAGANANYTGSGGAIVAASHDDGHAAKVEQALAEIGCAVMRG
jgi:glucuronokinase